MYLPADGGFDPLQTANALSAFIEKLNGYFRLKPAERVESLQRTETRCGNGQSCGRSIDF